MHVSKLTYQCRATRNFDYQGMSIKVSMEIHLEEGESPQEAIERAEKFAIPRAAAAAEADVERGLAWRDRMDRRKIARQRAAYAQAVADAEAQEQEEKG